MLGTLRRKEFAHRMYGFRLWPGFRSLLRLLPSFILASHASEYRTQQSSRSTFFCSGHARAFQFCPSDSDFYCVTAAGMLSGTAEFVLLNELKKRVTSCSRRAEALG